eukprot:3651546-Pyramimonas_sp.AAC.1
MRHACVEQHVVPYLRHPWVAPSMVGASGYVTNANGFRHGLRHPWVAPSTECAISCRIGCALGCRT